MVKGPDAVRMSRVKTTCFFGCDEKVFFMKFQKEGKEMHGEN